MKYTTLLMDADDTIFDFPKCEKEALRKSLEYYGLEFSDEINRNFSSINSALWKQFEKNRITRSKLRVRRFRELIEKCFEGFSDADMLADRYVEELSHQGILLPGSEEALKLLSEYFEIDIITNGLKTVQRGRFSKTHITKYINKIYISDEIGMNKPQKVFFDYVLGDLKEKNSSKILVVGDSLTSDMQGGRNAGLDTCLFDPEDKVKMPDILCDYKIKRLEEIMELACEENK